MLRGVAAIGMAALYASACGPFVGDPGRPVAIQGSGSERLGAVLLLLCPGERVVSLQIGKDVGKGSEPKLGDVLWSVEALEPSQPSSLSEFLPGVEPRGFRTLVPAPLDLTGDVAISFWTTREKGLVGIRIRPLPQQMVWFHGHTMTRSAFLAKGKDRCG